MAQSAIEEARVLLGAICPYVRIGCVKRPVPGRELIQAAYRFAGCIGMSVGVLACPEDYRPV